MCSSLNEPQNSHVIKQGHWRPWEQSQYSNSQQSHAAPKSSWRNSPLKCEVCSCNVTFKRESELKRHTLSKHYKKRENCKVCQKVFTRKDNLTRHYKLAHSEDEKPFCKFCTKSLSRRDAVQRHEATCSKNPSKKQEKSAISEINYPSFLERLKMKHQKAAQTAGNVKFENGSA